jgi:hypothetical protein
MTKPVAPASRALTPATPAAKPANEAVFPAETSTSTASAATGWDPYEVWRTRVMAPQPGKNKG